MLSVTWRPTLQYHFYADSQVYMTFKPKETIARNETLRRIEACLNKIILQMNNNFPKFNADNRGDFCGVEDLTVRVGDSVIKPSTTVRNLGAVLAGLSF